MKRIAVVIILLLGIGSVFFYWYQIRPAQIRHDCSWVKKHSDASPGRPAMTKAELEAKGIIRTCKAEYELANKLAPNFDLSKGEKHSLFDNRYTLEQNYAILKAIFCREDSDKVIGEYKKEIKATPARDWYVAATKEEYNFCLHDKGL